MLTRYQVEDKFAGVTIIDVMVDRTKEVLNLMYKNYEGENTIMTFAEFLMTEMPTALVIDMDLVKSEVVRAS